ncbi:hypothetical protein ABIB54_000230 [Frigoribacterium sp. UYMn621]
MGLLTYGSGNAQIIFDDRALFHLMIVITAKLRRRENFLFTWAEPIDVGCGRVSVWLDPSSALLYHFHGNRMPSVNREWIEVLTVSANGGGGLMFIPEPGLGRSSALRDRDKSFLMKTPHLGDELAAGVELG